MKRITHFLSIAFVFILSSCSSALEISPTKKETNLAVKGSRFRGTIFTEKYPSANFHVSDVDFSKRFTPTKEDIEKVEMLLKQQIKEVNKLRPNQFKNSPIIDKNINNYFRQYVGFIHRNERIVHINFYWDKYSLKNKLKGYTDDRLSFEDDYAAVFDGGSRYWQVNVNLTTGKVTDLQVNGVA